MPRIASRFAKLETFTRSSRVAARGSIPYLYESDAGHFLHGALKSKTVLLGRSKILYARWVGIEPTTNSLTANCSTAELPPNI